jgi:hypothetical protein
MAADPTLSADAARRAASRARAVAILETTPPARWPRYAMFVTPEGVELISRAGAARRARENDLGDLAAAIESTRCAPGQLVLVAVSDASGVTVIASDLTRKPAET